MPEMWLDPRNFRSALAGLSRSDFTWPREPECSREPHSSPRTDCREAGLATLLFAQAGRRVNGGGWSGEIHQGGLRGLQLLKLEIGGHFLGVLMILRGLPHTPGHDGVRLFLPAFGILSLLAGLGARSLGEHAGALGDACRHRGLGRGGRERGGDDAGAALVLQPDRRRAPGRSRPGDGADLLLGRPKTGSPPLADGAHVAGSDHSVRDIPPFVAVFAANRRVAAPVVSDRSRPRFPDPPQWYVLQNRPGAFSDTDRALVSEALAEYTVTKLGVPLVWIFPHAEWDRRTPRRRRES